MVMGPDKQENGRNIAREDVNSKYTQAIVPILDRWSQEEGHSHEAYSHLMSNGYLRWIDSVGTYLKETLSDVEKFYEPKLRQIEKQDSTTYRVEFTTDGLHVHYVDTQNQDEAEKLRDNFHEQMWTAHKNKLNYYHIDRYIAVVDDDEGPVNVEIIGPQLLRVYNCDPEAERFIQLARDFDAVGAVEMISNGIAQEGYHGGDVLAKILPGGEIYRPGEARRVDRPKPPKPIERDIAA